MRGRSSDYDLAKPVDHDRVILDTVREGMRIRQIGGPPDLLRVTIGSDTWTNIHTLFLRGDRLEAADLLERCARALRSLR